MPRGYAPGSISAGFQGTHGPRRAWNTPPRQAAALSGAGGRSQGCRGRPCGAGINGGRGRRGWRKLHRGVDQSGLIRVHTLTEATGEDATTALDLLTAVEGPLVRVTADAPSDTGAVYETATARGAKSSSHRPRRRTSLATACGRPRGIGRARW